MRSAFGIEHGLIAKYEARGYSGAFGANRFAVNEVNRKRLKLVPKGPDTEQVTSKKKPRKKVTVA